MSFWEHKQKTHVNFTNFLLVKMQSSVKQYCCITKTIQTSLSRQIKKQIIFTPRATTVATYIGIYLKIFHFCAPPPNVVYKSSPQKFFHQLLAHYLDNLLWRFLFNVISHKMLNGSRWNSGFQQLNHNNIGYKISSVVPFKAYQYHRVDMLLWRMLKILFFC